MSFAILGVLIMFRFLCCLVLLTGLIVVCLVPKEDAKFESEVPKVWKSSRIAAIVFFSVALGLGVLTIIMQMLNFFILQTSRILTLIINFFDLIMALGLMGVSIPLIVANAALPSSVYTSAVNKTLFLVSGIFGILAVLFYLLDLFVSRFYQFSVYEDSWYDDLWEYIYKYFYPIPPIYHVDDKF